MLIFGESSERRTMTMKPDKSAGDQDPNNFLSRFAKIGDGPRAGELPYR